MDLAGNDKILRNLTNLWTMIFFGFIFFNFFSMNAYGFLIAPMSIVYTGLLTLYVGTKEFDRWYETHESRHPGEFFVIIWTVVIIFLVSMSIAFGESYQMPLDAIVGVYIAVLSLFALTQKSKSYHRYKHDNGERHVGRKKL